MRVEVTRRETIYQSSNFCNIDEKFSLLVYIFCVIREQYNPRSRPETTRPHQAQALAKLHEARGDLLRARLAALDAQLWLVGARVSNVGAEQCSDARVKRAAQLCELIADTVTHAERLLFFVEGDTQCPRR